MQIQAQKFSLLPLLIQVGGSCWLLIYGLFNKKYGENLFLSGRSDLLLNMLSGNNNVKRSAIIYSQAM